MCFIEEALKSLAEREQDTMMATIMDGGGNYELEESREEEDPVEETKLATAEGATAVVAEDPFADEEDVVPTRHLSTSSEGSSIEIGVGEEVNAYF